MKQALFILLLSTPFVTFSQTNQKELVMIRVIEASKGCFQRSLIHVTKQDGQYETIDLEQFKLNGYLTTETENQKKIHSKIQEFLNEGYELKSHTNGQFSDCAWSETYVLIK